MLLSFHRTQQIALVLNGWQDKYRRCFISYDGCQTGIKSNLLTICFALSTAVSSRWHIPFWERLDLTHVVTFLFASLSTCVCFFIFFFFYCMWGALICRWSVMSSAFELGTCCRTFFLTVSQSHKRMEWKRQKERWEKKRKTGNLAALYSSNRLSRYTGKNLINNLAHDDDQSNINHCSFLVCYFIK